MNETPELLDLIRDEIKNLIEKYEMCGATVVVGIATGDGKTGDEGFTYTSIGGYFACLGLANRLHAELLHPCPLEDDDNE